ncbi:MAG: hypothetical protein IH989_06565, partial [Planctomycetes bacterium]|nr:hypothetical protein [Planctomycetota bacterium]
MDTAMILTDAGKAHVKVLGNKEGPHALSCELVCTQLAEWIGLPTLDWSILELGESDTFELNAGRFAEPGPAFATRTIEPARPWSGDSKELSKLTNVEMIPLLVVFDTLIRNDDRYPPVDDAGVVQSKRKRKVDNVLLTAEGAQPKELRLIAMDFGRGLSTGKDLSPALSRAAAVKDELIYGLFPEFQPFVTQQLVQDAVAQLQRL